jgi:hypothetical protein
MVLVGLVASPAQAGAARVTVDLWSDIDVWNGSCEPGVRIKFTGQIGKTGGPATVNYVWTWSDQELTTTEGRRVTFPEPGRKYQLVTEERTFTESGTYWLRLRANGGDGSVSAQHTVRITCTATKVTAAMTGWTPRWSGICGEEGKTFRFTGRITAGGGAATIKYRWVGNANGPGRWRTLEFAGGQKTWRVSLDTAPIRRSTSGYRVLQVVSPYEAWSKRAPYTITCGALKDDQVLNPTD